MAPGARDSLCWGERRLSQEEGVRLRDRLRVVTTLELKWSPARCADPRFGVSFQPESSVTEISATFSEASTRLL